jgi:hypothetical protein
VVGAIFYSHIDTWWVSYFVHTLISGGCHILFTHWLWWVPYFVHTLIVVGTLFFSVWTKYGTHHNQCVNKIWHPPRINVWIKYGTHHLSMCEQNMVPTSGGCHILFTHWLWWVSYFIHTLIVVGAIFCSHIDCGGYHILFTHWYVVGTIFCSHIDRGGCHILFTHWSWWVSYFVHTLICGPHINVWIKYGTHHLSMCEQNMVPTTHQCVNKIWYPPRFTHWYVVGTIFCSHIDAWWVPYFVHTLMPGGYHILFTHWSWWVPYFVHTLIYQCVNKIWYPPRSMGEQNMTPTTYQCVNKIWYPPRSMCEQNMVPTTYQCVNKIWHPPLYHILFTHWCVVGAIFCSHIDRGGYHILFTHWYVVGTIFYSHIDRGGCHITKYGTHHVSMCE